MNVSGSDNNTENSIRNGGGVSDDNGASAHGGGNAGAQKNRAGKKTLALMGVLIALLACAATAIGVRLAAPVREDGTTEPDGDKVSAAERTPLSGDSRFLIIGSGGIDSGIDFMLLAEFKVYSGQVVITRLDADAQTDGQSYAQAYAYGGVDSLKSAVERVRQCAVDRYAVIDSRGFSGLTDALGAVALNVVEPFTYQASDKTNTVSAGENELEADTLYTYLKLLYSVNGTQDFFTQTVCDIVNLYLSSADSGDSLSLFGEISNCITSDITIEDYYSATADIEYLLNNGAQCVAFGG